MANGTVKWFNATKGFGFIAPEGGGKDVFVHISALERAGMTGLADDQKVTFDIEAGRDGRESASKAGTRLNRSDLEFADGVGVIQESEQVCCPKETYEIEHHGGLKTATVKIPMHAI